MGDSRRLVTSSPVACDARGSPEVPSTSLPAACPGAFLIVLSPRSYYTTLALEPPVPRTSAARLYPRSSHTRTAPHRAYSAATALRHHGQHALLLSPSLPSSYTYAGPAPVLVPQFQLYACEARQTWR